VIAGIFIAYVDSRPTWDDTGITVGFILLARCALALAGYKQPWLLALAVGGWLPLYEIIASRSFASLVALFFAFIGAYAGWGFRLVIQKVFRTA
jgi:hypothetical protein